MPLLIYKGKLETEITYSNNTYMELSFYDFPNFLISSLMFFIVSYEEWKFDFES